MCNAALLFYSPEKEFIVKNVAPARGRKSIDDIAMWIQVHRVLFILSEQRISLFLLEEGPQGALSFTIIEPPFLDPG